MLYLVGNISRENGVILEVEGLEKLPNLFRMSNSLFLSYFRLQRSLTRKSLTRDYDNAHGRLRLLPNRVSKAPEGIIN